MLLDQSRKLLKIALGLFGIALCIVGLWYLANFINQINLKPHLAELDALSMTILAVLTMCLVVANGLIALSWRAILTDFGGVISMTRAQVVFSQSNLGKYVPGNILHMVGRQLLAMREGVPGWIVAKSLTLEIILLILSSALFAAALGLSYWIGGITDGLLALILLVLAIVCIVLLRQFGLSGSARAIVGYCVYHLIGGVVFVLIFQVFGASALETSTGLVIVAYVTSWMLGLLTPGAPGGLGVREAALIGLLQHDMTNLAVLGVAVLLSRGMSIVADVVYFLTVQGWCLVSSRRS